MTIEDQGSGEVNHPGLPAAEGSPGAEHEELTPGMPQANQEELVSLQVGHDDVLNYRV